MAKKPITLVEAVLPELKGRTPFADIKEKDRLRVKLPNGKVREGIVFSLVRDTTPQGGPYLNLLTRQDSEGKEDLGEETRRIYDIGYDVYVDAWGKVAVLDSRLGDEEGHADYSSDPRCCWHVRDKMLTEAGLPRKVRSK